MTEFVPMLGPDAGRTRIVDRVQVAEGITLTTAPVVVSGGRGVGSEEGFAAIEALAELLGAAVGCSRVVTNQGWRPHADQVGQTGKRVAPTSTSRAGSPAPYNTGWVCRPRSTCSRSTPIPTRPW